MFKKICFVLMFTLTAWAAFAAVKVDHSSEEAVISSFIRAYGEMDVEAIWEILPPALRKSIMEESANGKGKESFIAAFKESVTIANIEQMKKIAANKDILAQVAKVLVQQYKDCLVNDRNKWYLDTAKIGARTLSKTATVKSTDSAIDHSTKEKLLESFYRAMLAGDGKLAWETMLPSARQKVAFDTQQEEIFQKNMIAGFNAKLNPAQRQKIKAALDDPKYRDVFIRAVLVQLESAMVMENGKWYLDPLKMIK